MSKALEAFRTISEVALDLEVPKHVLRFWEVKFPQIRPMKRGGGRRYYRPEDMILLRGIQHLLHAEGYTIKGVQKILREQGIEQVKVHGLAATERAERTAAGTKRGPGGKKASAVAAAARIRELPVVMKRGKQPGGFDAAGLNAVIAELKACRDRLKVAGATSATKTAAQPASPARTKAARASRG